VLLDKKRVAQIDMSGKGGGEKKFAPALPGYTRVSAPLYDFEQGTHRIELKKQKNLQWFDGWKYHNLSNEDRNILMLLALHDGKQVEYVYSIPLGDMVDILLSDSEYDKGGWTAAILQKEYNLKQVAPKRQSKLPLKVRDFVKKYGHRVVLLYDRP
jgi:hypothetical protein